MVKFLKWFVKTSIVELSLMGLCALAMVLWGEDGFKDRKIGIPILSFILIVALIGKYRYWSKNLKNGNRK